MSPDSTTVASAASTADVPLCPDLTCDQERQIQRAACEIIMAEVNRRPYSIPDNTLAGAAQKNVMGVYVTLKRQGRLRACCGTFGQPIPLAQALATAAKRTATEDRRLPAISPTELPSLDLVVTLLYGFEPMADNPSQRPNQVEIGKHGLHIQRGKQGGLLLPSVATEQGCDAEQFLRHVCHKARLPSNAWSDPQTRLMRFQGHSIPGRFSDVLDVHDTTPRMPFTVNDTRVLADHCRKNLLLMRQGGTPNFYLQGGADGDVLGFVLTIDLPCLDEPIQMGNISWRATFPLQSTLFSICQTAVRLLAGRQFDETSLKVELAILVDLAMHGFVDSPDLRGFDPQQRGSLALESGHSGFVFDPEQTPEELVAAAAAGANVRTPAAAELFSFAVVASSSPVHFNNVPKAAEGVGDRAPAVAGSFYPKDAQELAKMVDGFLNTDTGEKKDCRAIMLPHAGLVYSGRIAGAVLAQIEIPDRVIIISPKHTRLGVAWAVAPHGRWLIPGGSLDSDPELAAKLAAAVPGLELDAGAHLREHGIESELPFLHRLAPDTKVVGITVAGGCIDQAREFAQGLARVLRSLPQQPLLVISSDMNHYATDAENRKLDEMALEAMETLDAEKLLATCREHNISMCGVLPAAIVMETLRELGQLHHSERVAYGTSADISGDKSRVVGYAGMIVS